MSKIYQEFETSNGDSEYRKLRSVNDWFGNRRQSNSRLLASSITELNRAIDLNWFDFVRKKRTHKYLSAFALNLIGKYTSCHQFLQPKKSQSIQFPFVKIGSFLGALHQECLPSDLFLCSNVSVNDICHSINLY